MSRFKHEPPPRYSFTLFWPNGQPKIHLDFPFGDKLQCISYHFDGSIQSVGLFGLDEFCEMLEHLYDKDTSPAHSNAPKTR